MAAALQDRAHLADLQQVSWLPSCWSCAVLSAHSTDFLEWAEANGLWLRLLIWCTLCCRAGLVVVLLGVGATLVFTTSQIGQ